MRVDATVIEHKRLRVSVVVAEPDYEQCQTVLF